MLNFRELAKIYREAHNIMRNVDGLQPQEAFDELLKYLFFKQNYETSKEAQKQTTKISANEVKKLFSSYLGKNNSWSSKIWREKKFYLSNTCLADIHELLFQISFKDINYDVRSHALREFLSSDLRKGHGIFLTPDGVVAAMVEFMKPTEETRVLDPACGSGTFLIETLNHIQDAKKLEVFGNDKSARMLLLADLNLGHYPKVKFSKRLSDALKEDPFKGKFDLILTNPPFGVTLDSRDYNFKTYKTCIDTHGYVQKKQTSEIVFIEKCLQMLKPGGKLAIVIPKSIATNNSLSQARHALSDYGYIFGVMSLPPETFASTGTQTTTIVLYIKKYKNNSEANQKNKIAFANIKNVGFDATGRTRDGNQLPVFPELMRMAVDSGIEKDFVYIFGSNKKADSFDFLEEIFIKQANPVAGVKLSELCEYIGTGKTPARKAYSESGTFLIKVGNLTGAGIKWEARDRNFISDDELAKRISSKRPLILKSGDILLTSSAHSPVYIAKKSDIYTGTPEFLSEKKVSYVGEVMLIRVKKEKISPYLLLAFLRSAKTIDQIQNMVRGQTAHLHANDLSQLIIPNEVFKKGSIYQQASEIISKQAKLNEEMNRLVSKQNRLLA